VIPTIITQCLSGDTINIGATHPTRDLNYVSNTVDGFLRAASCDKAIGEVINLGSGREISIGDLALLIGKLFGKDLPIVRDKQRLRPNASEVERLLACNEKAKNLLGWTPAVDLETGLARTIEWFQSHLDRYRPGVYTV
jgi:dTDP-glucose 4,6-dehydratase